MKPQLAKRFLHFDRLAAETEIANGMGRGTLHFSIEELAKNNDTQMCHLLCARVRVHEEVVSDKEHRAEAEHLFGPRVAKLSDEQYARFVAYAARRMGEA